jgi:hypothetical protein
MTSKNAAINKPAEPAFVRTKISGVVISLPSEGQTDVNDAVILSNGLQRAIQKWSLLPVADYSDQRRDAIVERLIGEAMREFGVDRGNAAFYTEIRVDHARAMAKAPSRR